MVGSITTQSPARRTIVALSWAVLFVTSLPMRAEDAPPAYCSPDDKTAHDFRSRNSSELLRWAYDDNWMAHASNALTRLSQGELTKRVMHDLDWTLHKWPNHVPAMQGMVQYFLAGGLSYNYDELGCYFTRARRFAPDDISVLLQEAYYYWRKSDYPRALAVYADALRIDPKSPDVHYNMGLVYFDQKDMAKALEHAQLAYSAGYPLPGLRNKLERAGQWKAPGPPTAANSAELAAPRR
ncbi:MAG: tetratricopeptide repeat protein [Pseudomonadales bacterium]|nr:tetratricopeptide repeat protein [Pseudomonadales bacterium]